MTEIRDAVLGGGVQILDAPVGAGVAAAQHGCLHLLVGGQAQAVAQHRELLEVLASPGQLLHVGGYGAGYTAKLLMSTSKHCAGTDRQTGNSWAWRCSKNKQACTCGTPGRTRTTRSGRLAAPAKQACTSWRPIYLPSHRRLPRSGRGAMAAVGIRDAG
jgi:6-phosphogluconate dehydrogenase-like protein